MANKTAAKLCCCPASKGGHLVRFQRAEHEKAMQKLKRAYPNAQDNLFVGYGHGDIIGHPDVMARDIIAFMKS